MQHDNGLAVLSAGDLISFLERREQEIMDVIEAAYCAHRRGNTKCPHSLFLRLPSGGSRIIALPAYIGEDVDAAGVKWISSFPSNLEAGLPRASALIVLNSVETGRAYAVMEGSIISAKRTAASAAVAAKRLVADPDALDCIGIIGCGEINREILRFTRKTLPLITQVRVFDTNPERSRTFRTFCEDHLSLKALPARSITEVLSGGQLISIATTAVTPHIQTLSACPSSTVILHISLRDIAPEALFSIDNIVDDPDHACRENTSLDLAAKALGHRRLIRTTIGEILTGAAPPTLGDGRTVVFSPFGLGILDLSLAIHVYRAICSSGRICRIPGFHAEATL
ncbi:MAG TPA: 2,3-diaminopropionate biosynthesis protein SbnB [Blastocatellia bacterium]|nr:2,3-diaminopropionate biosynthesis protein SbnB [Blastocatellia bacterium]